MASFPARNAAQRGLVGRASRVTLSGGLAKATAKRRADFGRMRRCLSGTMQEHRSLRAPCLRPKSAPSRRINLMSSRSNSPWTKAGHIDALPYRYCTILMPTQRPVPVSGLVKQYRAHSHGAGSDQSGCDAANRAWGRNQPAQRRAVADPQPRLIGRIRCQNR